MNILFSHIIFYHLVLVIAIGIAYIASTERIKLTRFSSKIINFLPLVLIILIAGLRYNVGTDYSRYVDFFYMIKKGSFINIEPGYYWLNKIFSTFSNGYILVFFICSIITYGLLFKVLLQKKIFFLGLFFFFCFFFLSFNSIIRQAVAISIFLFSTKYIEEKNFSRYLVYIFLGALFHRSILFLIPFYFVNSFNLSVRSWLLLFAISLIIVYSNLFYLLLDNYIRKIPLFGNYIGGQYAQNKTNTGIGVLLKILLGAIVLGYKDILIIKNSKNLVYINLFLIGIVGNIFAIQADIISRLSHYFFFTSIVILPFLLSGTKTNKALISAIIILVAIAFWENELWFNINHAIPYQTVFNLK